MTIRVAHQKPAVLDPVHTIPIVGDYDPMPAFTSVVIDPLFVPLRGTTPVTITDDRGQDITANIQGNILSCFGDTVSPDDEQIVKQLFEQSLVSFTPDTILPMEEAFAIQAAAVNQLPDPRVLPDKLMNKPAVLYTAASDVVPAAKALLAGTGDESTLFASIAYAYHPNTLGVWFQSTADFDDFKTWLRGQVQNLSSVLPTNTLKLLGEVDGLTLSSLTEAIRLRADSLSENDEYSFARVITHMCMSYVTDQRQRTAQTSSPMVTGIMPFTVSELFCPLSIVFINVEAHARATPARVDAEWAIINQGIASPVKVVSRTTLSKLDAVPRRAAKAQIAATQKNNGAPIERAGNVVFRKKAPTQVDILADLSRVLKRMGNVNRSQNAVRSRRRSFSRANRRDPDNYNLAGQLAQTAFMPDIHVYVDTSGSISEENYQDSVITLITVAKKLNVNLYFNSFSHVLSEETLLRTQGKSIQQIWKEFSRVPKVTGATDYQQIWKYVTASAERRKRLSLVITDFEWSAPPTRETHPKNLYYAPCSAMDWASLKHWADSFVRSMAHIDPLLTHKFIGMYR